MVTASKTINKLVFCIKLTLFSDPVLPQMFTYLNIFVLSSHRSFSNPQQKLSQTPYQELYIEYTSLSQPCMHIYIHITHLVKQMNYSVNEFPLDCQSYWLILLPLHSLSEVDSALDRDVLRYQSSCLQLHSVSRNYKTHDACTKMRTTAVQCANSYYNNDLQVRSVVCMSKKYTACSGHGQQVWLPKTEYL